MLQICCFCKNDFDDEKINFFCSEICSNQYWNNPIIVELSTDCPSCNKLFKRNVYSIEVSPISKYVLCKECRNDECIIYSKSK